MPNTMQGSIYISKDSVDYIGQSVFDFIQENYVSAKNDKTVIYTVADFDGATGVEKQLDAENLAQVLRNVGDGGVTAERILGQSDLFLKHTNIGFAESYLLQSNASGELHFEHIVTAPNILNPADFMYAATSIDRDEFSELIQNLNPEDFRSYLLLHEIGHTQDGEDGLNQDRSERELFADTYANRMYAKGLAEGVFSDPNVPQIWSHLRAMTQMVFLADSDYPYNGALNPHTNKHDIDPEKHGKYDFVDDMLDAIHFAIAEQSRDDLVIQFEALRMYLAYDEDELSEILSKDQLSELKRMDEVYGYDDPPLDAVENFFDMGVSIPEEHQRSFDIRYTVQMNSAGREIAKEQPELLYEFAKRNLVEGKYDQDPAQKYFMENFVVGAERLAPGHFGVEEGETPYLDYMKSNDREMKLAITPDKVFSPPSDEADSLKMNNMR